MIPLLSIMIGVYIITHMLHLLIDKEKISTITTVFAVLTILVTVCCVYNIVKTGGSIADLLSM